MKRGKKHVIFILLLALAILQTDKIWGQERILNDPIYLEVTTDKSEVWIGEPISWKCCLWRCLAFEDDLSYIPPITEDFVSLSAPQHDRVEIKNGRKYVGNQLSMALIAQRPGNLSIGSVQITIPRSAISPISMIEFADFFNKLFLDTARYDGSSGEHALLVSPPLNILAKELPKSGRPSCFSGAVGKYKVKAEIDRTSLTTDETVTLKLHIEGEGNIGLMEPPNGAVFEGFRLLQQRSNGGFSAFELNSEDAILAGNALAHMAQPQGKRTFIYILKPLKEGKQLISVPDIAYFEPESARYIVERTPPITISVAPGLAKNALQFGPEPVTPSLWECFNAIHKLPIWSKLALTSPLFGWAVLTFSPPTSAWSHRYLKWRLQKGANMSSIWQEWLIYRGYGHMDLDSAIAKMKALHLEKEPLNDIYNILTVESAKRFGQSEVNMDKATVDSFAISLSRLDDSAKALGIGEKSDIERKDAYGTFVRWYREHRSFLALSTSSLAMVAMFILTLGWGTKTLESYDLSYQACILFAKGDISGSEAIVEKAYKIAEDETSCSYYNRGCLAWQRGMYSWAHYLFTRACLLDGFSDIYKKAWQSSSSKLQLKSLQAPKGSWGMWPYWVWSVFSFLAMRAFTSKCPRSMIFLSFISLMGISSTILSSNEDIVMIRADGILRSGPASQYEVEGIARPGTIALVKARKNGYILLETLAGQDEFYRLCDNSGEFNSEKSDNLEKNYRQDKLSSKDKRLWIPEECAKEL